ncbi:MAG: hypothetical protein ABR591_03475 [Candidatus Velthaea sp.]
MNRFAFARSAALGAVISLAVAGTASAAGDGGVVRTPMTASGLTAVLYAPADVHPGVVVLGGSEGGNNEREAARPCRVRLRGAGDRLFQSARSTAHADRRSG